nr:hypothetical protein JVH1_0726 [Rhodococcus sp. JVH1]
MPTRVHSDGGPTVRREATSGVTPGMPGLPAPVQQQNQALSVDARFTGTRRRWIPPVGGKRDTVTAEFGLSDYRIHGVPHQHRRVEPSPMLHHAVNNDSPRTRCTSPRRCPRPHTSAAGMPWA